MNAKTAKIDDDTDGLIEAGAQATGLSKKAVLAKAVRYYVPRLIAGEISVVEKPDQPRELSLVAAASGGAR